MRSSHSEPTVRLVAGPEALAGEAARLVREHVQAAVRARGRCLISLAGGQTPQGLYAELAKPAPDEPAIDWQALHLFFGDERHVPPEHPDSNYRMVSETWLSRVPVPAAQVYRMPTEREDATLVAAEYEATIRQVCGLHAGEWPALDLVILGMGRDGHTASIFPRTPALEEREHLATAVWVISLQSSRVTLTLPVFNHAREVLLVVGGVEKAETLRAVLEGPLDAETYPVQAVRPLAPGRLTWLVDQAAASRLSRPRRDDGG